MIRSLTESAFERRLAEVDTRPVREGEERFVEVTVELTIRKLPTGHRVRPRSIYFTLSPEQAERLADQLRGHAREARGEHR